MNYLKSTLCLILVWTCIHSIAQKSQKQIELEENKVYIFTDEERANIQYQFYEKTQKMGMSDELEAEYSRILIYHFYDMTRLDDKDQGNTEQEVKIKLKGLVNKMNSEIKPILSDKQYNMHLSNFNAVLKAAYRRNNWDWDLD